MSKTDDILERLKGQQPMIDDPDALTERIMSSLPDLELDKGSKQPKAREVKMRWWMSAAASLLLIIGIGVMIVFIDRQKKDESLVAEHVKQEPKTSPLSVQTEKTVSTDALNTTYKQEEQTVQTIRTIENSSPKSIESASNESEDRIQEPVIRSHYADPNLHYAAYVPAADSTYQAPSRMDEFIAKMAAFNEVEAVSMDCTPGDSMAVGKAYVFNDKQELNLFGRLLQAACWYDSKTPGYLLNFSHQQFFFTLKDLHKNEKYLWIAERIVGGRILLYSSHSPIETDISSACYQKYREQLTQANYSTLQF